MSLPDVHKIFDLVSHFPLDEPNLTSPLVIVDGPLVQEFHGVAEVTIGLIVRLGGVLLFNPIFIFPASVVGALGGWLGQIYITAQLPVKREMSNAKAPVLAQYVPYILSSPSSDLELVTTVWVLPSLV